MDPQLIRVLIGSLVLLVVVLLPVQQVTRSRYGFLGLLIGAVTTVCGVALTLHLGDFVIADEGEAIVKSQIDLMHRDQAHHVPKNLIIIEGSSQTELGIDAPAIESQLRSAGYDVTVIELAGAGGNHLERFSLLSRFAAEMRRQGLAASANTRLLLEVAPEYDGNPTIFFMTNKDTLRGYHFSSFGNFWFAVQSLQIINGSLMRNRTALATLLHNAVVSSLDVGLVLQMQRFDDLEPIPPFAPKDQPEPDFEFKAYAADKYTRKPAAPLEARWIRFTRYRTGRISSLFDGSITETDYFSVPTVDYDKQMRYVRSFCRWRGASPCIDATDPALYGSLDSADDYFNTVHLSGKGAEIYSRYFAEQLIAQKMVVK